MTRGRTTLFRAGPRRRTFNRIASAGGTGRFRHAPTPFRTRGTPR